MNILVTGAKGFVGQNLVAILKSQTNYEIFEFDRDSDPKLLKEYCKRADFIFHLAGVNRPKDTQEFAQDNVDLIRIIIDSLSEYKNSCPIIFSSSIQATVDNPYGKSKKEGEELLLEYGNTSGAKVMIFRIPNVFGKWCRPNYNSFVATLCYNVIHDIPIEIHDPNHLMNLVYIDDLVRAMADKIQANEQSLGYCNVPVSYFVTLEKISELIHSFKKGRETLYIPDVSDDFTKKLYSTYISYLPKEQLNYKLMKNVDHRGSFTEFMKGSEFGQLSVNISKPGIIRGNHYHHVKHEKFLIISGEAILRLRRINSVNMVQYTLRGEEQEIVDIPAGYAHNIENVGSTDLIIIIWACESYDPENPDTYYMEV